MNGVRNGLLNLFLSVLSVVIAAVGILLLPNVSIAQDYQKDPFTLEGQGQLLSVRMEIGAKSAKIFLVGKETAKLDFAKDAKLVQLTAFQKTGTEEVLQFEPGQGYYTVKKLPDWEGPYLFRLETRIKNQTEKIELHRK